MKVITFSELNESTYDRNIIQSSLTAKLKETNVWYSHSQIEKIKLWSLSENYPFGIKIIFFGVISLVISRERPLKSLWGGICYDTVKRIIKYCVNGRFLMPCVSLEGCIFENFTKLSDIYPFWIPYLASIYQHLQSYCVHTYSVTVIRRGYQKQEIYATS